MFDHLGFGATNLAAIARAVRTMARRDCLRTTTPSRTAPS
jgi:hypothetical protein